MTNAKDTDATTTRDAAADNGPSAYMILDETSYVRTIWFMSADEFNVLGWMYRTPGQPWNVGYRFRWYDGIRDRAFNSGDRKSGYIVTPASAEPTDVELDAIAGALSTTLTELAERLRVMGDRAECHRLDCDCLGIAAGELIAAQPWGHIFHAGQTSLDRPKGTA